MVLYTDIESVVYDFNGVIYGGYVRDKMIKNYYTELYYTYGYLEKDINNIKIAKSLIKRTIIPNDMDIYFKSKEIADNLNISSELALMYKSKGLSILRTPFLIHISKEI